ncbi:M16 family metallopeptidase [Paraliomyxa miuraensis]|uniref:M16 family metallopeptidase n=1 Tax=Paraliomyxa miuraensis TaxID=376150 RepID=UPI0022510B04|nr:pitrilysin family protein [Paraliomyxa miuraensis]MCX4240759.1 insulinase family protein [Paraliomyxa miuraensis]
MSLRPWLVTLALSLATFGPAGCKTKDTTTDPDGGGGDGTAIDDDAADGAAALLPERPFDYQETALENGMRVITLADHSTPIAAVQVWYHVGSKDEKPDRRGFAHMFEHMMFRGTQNIGPKAHFEYVRRVGGDCNAYTSFDNTTYIQEIPSNQVEMVLWLEAERMAFLKINEGYFDTERQVVAEEYRLGREQPYGTAPDKILGEIFKQHPYRWTPIGDMDELAAASADELQEFWNTYYVPNNAALVVVGDVEHDRIVQLAETYFGWIPSYPEPPRVTVKEPPLSKPLEVKIKERNGPVPIVAVGYRTVPTGHEDELALEMLGQILGGGESSRLYRDLVTDRDLAIVALAAGFSLEDDGMFGAGAVMSPFGDEPDDALAAIRQHVAKLVADGVTEDELRKAKNGMLRDVVTSQLTVASKAQLLGDAALIKGDLPAVNRRFKEIEAISAADLKAAAAKYFDPQREIVVRIEPNLVGFLVDQFRGKKDEKKKDDRPQGPEEITGEGSGKPGLVRPEGLGVQPPVAPPKAPKVAIDHVDEVLPNGLEVVVIENHEVPFVSYRLGLRFGAFADPADMPGTASLAASMLTRGTEGYDYKALTDELDTHAISISPGVGMDTGSVTASAVTPQAARAMKLLAEVVQRPTFPQGELPKLVKQTRTGLAITERSPQYLADRELRRRMFPGHPYARLPEAQASELDAITVDGMKAWWSGHVRPDTTVLYVAGDLSKAEAFALAKEHFGGWKATGAAPTVSVPAAPPRSKTKIYLVDKPGEQAQIRVGHVGIDRTSEDWFTARVLSDVFGGGFNSRLNDTIRVKKGLTYGAGGGFSADRFGGRFVVSTFSKNATVGETVKTILEEIRRLQKEAPSEQEEQFSRSYLLGRFAGQRETPQDLVGDLWMLEVEGLPEGYYQQYLDAIAKVTSAQMNAVAKRLVHEDELVIVVVGSAKVLEKQLEKIGPVEVVDPSK